MTKSYDKKIEKVLAYKATRKWGVKPFTNT